MRRLTDSPTGTLVVVLVAVFALQQLVEMAAGVRVSHSLFALSTPVAVHVWTVITSVYAHGSVPHLLANLIALVLVGLPLERETTAFRFQAFFLCTGVLSGLAEVWFVAVVGGIVDGIVSHVSVLGASGAIFALLGYLLTSNRLTDRVVGTHQVSGRLQIVVFAFLAIAITLTTAGQHVALVAHFTGLLLGLLSGRTHLLRRQQTRPTPEFV